MISMKKHPTAADSRLPPAQPRAAPETGTAPTRENAAPCTSQVTSLSERPSVASFLHSTFSVAYIDKLRPMSLSLETLSLEREDFRFRKVEKF